MKTLLKTLLMCSLLASALIYLSGCNDDDEPQPQLTGDSKTFVLAPVSNPAVSGTVTFAERDDDKILVTIQLTGTQSGNSHPAHIHANSAAETGNIILDLTAVNGTDGKSETVVDALNDGTTVSYEDLLALDGYVNVHASESDLATLIAQGDIGVNELTGDAKVYTLTPVADPAVSGTLTIAKRQKGTSLVTVALTGTQAGATHSSHFHANSVAQGGPIVINLNAVNGTTGKAVTSVDTLNNGNAITYDELLNYNGHFNVHVGSSYVVQADIGGNELTGDTKVYNPTPVADPSVSGTLTIAKRKRGTSLVTVALTGTQPGATHNSHFHANTMAQGGSITINLKPVNGTTGKAITSVDTLNNGDPITYEALLDYNGHFNVHVGSSYVVQADIGQNELTGVHAHYELAAVGGSGVTGMATFDKRKNGKALITIELTGTTAGGSHPAHIHANSAAAGGAIVLDLKNVNGTTGISATSINTLNDATAITYDQLIAFNGHLNVHLSTVDLTVIAQGNIGSNAPQ